VHPTGGGHAVIAQYVLAELAAPGQVSMLGEAPLQVFEAQSRVLNAQMQADLGSQRANGTLRTFADFDYGHQRWDATVNSPHTSSDNSTLTIGGDYAVNDMVSLGGVSSIGYQNASFAGGGGFRNTEPLLSAYGLWHSPDWYVSLQAGIGQLNYHDVQRQFHLGAATRIESGDTSGSHTAIELAGGYWFNWDSVKSGPFASISHQHVRVDSYSEKGSDSSTMTFGRQSRSSTLYKIGWQLAGDSKLFDTNWHPYGRVAYEHESDNNVRNVSAGLATLNGTFSLPGYLPESSWWSAELGLSADFGNNLVGYVAYNGLFGNSTQRVDSGNIGIKWSF
jgi:outer membrane lipase/esterase